ncbi:MAG: hypothetical protein PWQ50_1530 [Methanolobus sp.]|jgi:hypothetical protein|nr:hypothetical protein [Methanolobus sp.]
MSGGKITIIYTIIQGAINNWDPVGLFPYAPPDEYDSEIFEISEFIDRMVQKGDIEENELASRICEVFSRSFGNDVFKAELGECLDVARKIKKKHITSLIRKSNYNGVISNGKYQRFHPFHLL